MGIIFTDKVEHRHGSKKVSRKTAKIEMKIKQEELKQLKQQRRQQQWLDLQERVQQQQVQQQYVPTVSPTTETQQEIIQPTITEEQQTTLNEETLAQIKEQQDKLGQLLTQQQQLKANEPPLTKKENAMIIGLILTLVITIPISFLIGVISFLIWCVVIASANTPHNTWTNEKNRIEKEIKATQELIATLKASLF